VRIPERKFTIIMLSNLNMVELDKFTNEILKIFNFEMKKEKIENKISTKFNKIINYNDYTGFYYSNELNSFHQIVYDEVNGLNIKINNIDVPLRFNLSGDNFNAPLHRYRVENLLGYFNRDFNDNVVGVLFNSDRSKEIFFKKINF
jgi:hypothetical protein